MTSQTTGREIAERVRAEYAARLDAVASAVEAPVVAEYTARELLTPEQIDAVRAEVRAVAASKIQHGETLGSHERVSSVADRLHHAVHKGSGIWTAFEPETDEERQWIAEEMEGRALVTDLYVGLMLSELTTLLGRA